MKRAVTVLKLSVVAAVAACILDGRASAQSFPMRGTFTLPYEVHCGRGVLPAGQYSIHIAGRFAPAFVRDSAGRSKEILLPRSVTAREAGPTSLRILRRGNQRIVQSFNWREGDVVFVYERLTNAEVKSLITNEDSATVPIAMGQK